jgi:hypothetical protein
MFDINNFFLQNSLFPAESPGFIPGFSGRPTLDPEEVESCRQQKAYATIDVDANYKRIICSRYH